VASLLVECGARLNATNALESTPLHTAACLPNFQKEVQIRFACRHKSDFHISQIRFSYLFFSSQIVELLLAEGGHVDMKNLQGVRPSQLLAANPASSVTITRSLSSLPSLSLLSSLIN
jgi:hypothetical protein